MAGDGTEQLIVDGKRLDGRKLDELRPTSIKVGILANADGSAEIRMGRNIIIAAVYGPRELHPKHRALPDKALIQCYYRMSTFSVTERKSPAPSRREREISKIISEALESVVLVEKYPRTTIDVYIQVLQADGGTRCASLTAASVALADAGIPMRGLISAVAAGLANDQVILDLFDIEDQKGSGDVPLGYSPALNEISLLQLDGVFTMEQFKEALTMGIEGAKQVYEIQKNALKQKYAQIREEVASEAEELNEVEKESQAIIEETVKEQITESETPPTEEQLTEQVELVEEEAVEQTVEEEEGIEAQSITVSASEDEKIEKKEEESKEESSVSIEETESEPNEDNIKTDTSESEHNTADTPSTTEENSNQIESNETGDIADKTEEEVE
ncbi:MAG: exosome complex exonuclease Rrp41 [Candidatus Heimdallarchaeaceae archaeon]